MLFVLMIWIELDRVHYMLLSDCNRITSSISISYINFRALPRFVGKPNLNSVVVRLGKLWTDIQTHKHTYDHCILFIYRFYHTFPAMFRVFSVIVKFWYFHKQIFYYIFCSHIYSHLKITLSFVKRNELFTRNVHENSYIFRNCNAINCEMYNEIVMQ